MSTTDIFEDYDDITVYGRVLDLVLDPGARNFVVEFGKNEAKIASNLDSTKFKQIVEDDNPPKDIKRRSVRWINIWGPNLQPDLINVIANRYSFSRRLRAILMAAPSRIKQEEFPAQAQRRAGLRKAKAAPKDDPELANGVLPEKQPPKAAGSPEDANHYGIASHLINYQSVDLGERFLCVGANFMYHLNQSGQPESAATETTEKRLWSWLILCDDSTVISLHEDANVDKAYMEDIRGHTRNVLKQLSAQGSENAGSVSVISVRSDLPDDKPESQGFEGSSNLFYYLFDNWSGTYRLVISTQKRLEELREEILDGLNQKHQKDANKDIIPGLYKIGKKLRANQHLYESYANVIDRIVKFKGESNSQSDNLTGGSHSKRVAVAVTASERFERLSDRIKLIVLSSIKEAIAETEALLNTFFNITAQKDSQATAKLSRNATLLSKLGVLFLPVSLMTSYFSVQIEDLQGVYTSNTYWISFAVVMAVSFIALFFLSRALVTLTESLEARIKTISNWCKQTLARRRRED